jgi:predicted ATPase/DNA-binding SARP family transcriptional activator
MRLNLKRARLLLAWLALRSSQSGSREEVAALLWSDRGEAQARQSLRQVLASIRGGLGQLTGEIIKVDRENIAIVRGAVDSDVAQLMRVEATSDINELQQVITNYNGEFMEGMTVREPLAQEWLEARRAELREVITTRFEWLLELYSRSERHTDAEPVAQRLLELDPLCEGAHRALIRAYLARGNRPMAARQYQRCRNILAQELSVEPAPETKRLMQLSGEIGAESSSAVRTSRSLPLVSQTRVLHNLPAQLTSLVGREREVDEILTRLRQYRVVTLTGTGGAGKTRVAADVGARLVGTFADGIWLVELASIADPRLLAEALCRALGVPVANDRPGVESALAFLRHKEALLIFDNCEHLLSACADVAQVVLRTCPSVSLLMTSRERLSLAGESLYRVLGLTFPSDVQAITASDAMSFSAVQLFVERAAAILDSFRLDEETVPAVASICRQVEGIPLAVELAAGRLRMMRADWLAANLGESFLSLRTGNRGTPAHHQTLRAMLDWSYDLLGSDEQALLCRLSVFAGGCTLVSATEVTAGEPVPKHQMFDLLSSLLEKSLLTCDTSQAEPRYRLLEITRRYAMEKQREADEPPREKELTHYLIGLLSKASETWAVTPTTVWLAKYEPELDNLRASLEWAFGRQGDVALGVELAGFSLRLWDELSLFRERSRWTEMAVAQQSQNTSLATRARLLLARTSQSAYGDQLGFSFVDEAVHLLRPTDRALDLGEALMRAGAALLTPDSVAKAEPFLDEALRVLEPLGPNKHMANCLRSKGVAAYFAHDFATARSLVARSLAVCSSVGDSRGFASAQIALAELDLSAGNLENAITGIQRMLHGRDYNHRQLTLGLANLAGYLLAAGHTEKAAEAALESLRQAGSLGWLAALVRAGEHLALVAVLKGADELAARLVGFADAFYANGTASRERTEQVTRERLRQELGRKIAPDRQIILMAEGALWSEQQVLEAAAAAADGVSL